ncbi:MAG: HPr kinase/phosphatase C-terminal domain-containing protein [Pseudomonadota bacterium]|jgi:serine kinase of HPr protein (carbohydrate metabolism regulator)
MSSAVLHASLIAQRQDGWWRGVLLRGASGVGKSELALRCLDRGWRLAADDRVVTWISAGRLFGRAPSPLLGLMEVRGIGVASICDPPDAVHIALVIDLVDTAQGIERYPEWRQTEILDITCPCVSLYGREVAAPDKVQFAFDHLNRRV